MSVSKDTYPTLKSNKAKQAGWWGIPLSASLGAICIPFVYYSVAGPLFYLYHRFCETNYVAGMTENLLVIGYGIVYIFSHEIWLLVLVSTYNEHVDILTMCKFVLQQLNRPRSVEV
ncbi:hypothetical protein HPULCUR_010241 [Helicostylum pulchrum]|uniref:Uncharacterized protein n=1 Tax=Helicostylum pulchrum TaxID=562976 RepID=A0ABP9YCP7_9FUNG